ncbi:MAG: hypothetical protein GHCLOJNM_02467 [bacterium]|nr:hypothetical protein [bacterium]
MTISIKAMYEHGVFRPTEPVDWEEGTPVEVSISGEAEDRPRRLPGEILAEIATLTAGADASCFSGEDHDGILYP